MGAGLGISLGNEDLDALRPNVISQGEPDDRVSHTDGN
jgi:hypothetical protein